MKTSKKTLILLAGSVIFTIGIGGIYWALFFLMKEKIEDTVTSLEKIEELSGKETTAVSAVSLMKKEGDNIEKLKASFLKENEIVDFTKRIEALGAMSGTTLTIESLDKGVTEKSVTFLNFRLKAFGSFTNVQRLLALLENFPGKLDWKTVRLVRSDEVIPVVETKPGVKTVVRGPLEPRWSMEASLVVLNFTN